MGTVLLIAAILAFIVAGGAFIFLYESRSGVTEKALGLAAVGKYPDARALIRDQLDLYPEDINLLFLMAKIYQMEGDFLNEASFLEKIVNIGRYTKEITHSLVTSRLADIYYDKEMYDEAFFYYMETLESDPEHVQALIRLAFMCLGQREFHLADIFFNRIKDTNIRFSAYYLGRGVLSAILEKNDEFEHFKKAYELDKESVTNNFLYALALSRARRHQEAIEIINKIVDLIHDDYLKYTIFLFLMVQYMLLENYPEAILNARLAVEIAMRNDWEQEIAESNLYCAMLNIAHGDLQEALFYVTEAEFRKPNDPDYVNMAQYRFDIEEGLAVRGSVSPKGYDFQAFMKSIPEKLFPNDRPFELSGLRMSKPINIRGIVNDQGHKIITKISQLAPDPVIRFIALKGNAFKNICIRIASDLGYKVKKELPILEADGVTYICVNRENEDEVALFRFRKWKNITISDVVINELLSAMAENNTKYGYLLGAFDLSSAAKKLYKMNENKIYLINGREFSQLVDKAMK